MKSSRKKLGLLFIIFIAIYIAIHFILLRSVHLINQQDLQTSTQMILVTTPDWNSPAGTLQRFERKSVNQPWEKVGAAIPVMIGKHGMAWGTPMHHIFYWLFAVNIKQEGDGKTPAGIYKIGPAFGFDEKSVGKLDYFHINDTSICVDDMSSQHYNQLFDGAKVPNKDWNSGEQMHTVPGYQIGSVVQYNMNSPTVGAGSCIFMHIWKTPTTGTAGCIAMDANNLRPVLEWLNAKNNPMMVTVIAPEYDNVKSQWKLP